MVFERDGCPEDRGPRRGRRSFLLLALVLGAMLFTTMPPAAAYVSTTVTIDGNMSDWTPDMVARFDFNGSSYAGPSLTW